MFVYMERDMDELYSVDFIIGLFLYKFMIKFVYCCFTSTSSHKWIRDFCQDDWWWMVEPLTTWAFTGSHPVCFLYILGLKNNMPLDLTANLFLFPFYEIIFARLLGHTRIWANECFKLGMSFFVLIKKNVIWLLHLSLWVWEVLYEY